MAIIVDVHFFLTFKLKEKNTTGSLILLGCDEACNITLLDSLRLRSCQVKITQVESSQVDYLAHFSPVFLPSKIRSQTNEVCQVKLSSNRLPSTAICPVSVRVQ